MSQTKRASKGKRPSKALSVLGIAGVSLAASTGGSVADLPSATLAASAAAGSIADLAPQNTVPLQVLLGEEEISDVSLATFHLFDKEDLGALGSRIQVARGGCGCGHGCGGCGHGCGGCGHGCGGRGCGGFGHGCGGFGRGCGGFGRGCGGFGRGCRGCFGRGCFGRGCGCGGCGWGWGWGWGWGGCCLSWGGCYLC
jgi:hypothetical protein